MKRKNSGHGGKRKYISIVLASFLVCLPLLDGCGTLWQQADVSQGGLSQEQPDSASQDNLSQGSRSEQEELSFTPISESYYGYQSLNSQEQQVYEQMLGAILNYQEAVPLGITDVDQLSHIYQVLTSDYGGLFWVEGYGYTTYTIGDQVVSLEFTPAYTMEEDQKTALQQQIDQVVDEWLAGISLQDSDYDKAKYVFETLIQRVDYQVGALENQNILSVFLYGETVCQGYACATQYLLRQLGIPCFIVSGYAGGESHAWNIVLLDGEYYYMDTTWGNSRYLDESSQEAKYVNYNYFTMTDAEISATHQWNQWIELPSCTSLADNYYVQEGLYFETWDPEAMGAVYGRAWENGAASASVKCGSVQLYQQLKDYLIQQQEIRQFCPGLEQVYYMEDPEFCVFTINFY